jgi:uncharacterized repeat protein (TIGR03803 family)
MTPSGLLTVLYSSFAGGSYGNLVLGSDGNFYGTFGYDPGSIFEMTPDGDETNLYEFTGYDDGSTPQAGLVQGIDGNFYGTTESGGTNDYGTIFKIGTNGDFTSLYSFTGGADGASPRALLLASDGNLYGATEGGGVYAGAFGFGTIFRLNLAGNAAPTTSAPVFTSPQVNQGRLSVTIAGVNSGQAIIVQASTDLVNWIPIQTNIASGPTLTLTNLSNEAIPAEFFRAIAQ